MFGKLFGGLFGKKKAPEATMGDMNQAGGAMGGNAGMSAPQGGMEGTEDTQNTV